ncbi:glycosyltransferase family 2 protein [Leuconostoc lactis]|uniref:glycosyltransferase family 2 protein n=1 Tax=Leuconostoc lactis TaxID=1246 RepID=UPI0009FC6641|nr:glycosyltransferase family A protein [Leuconostoc lactis]ORI85243.1 hypothetical protein BMS94_01815 [Leuconostoc lactis]ORI87132.1 hypothetical protein BMS96_02975 [Leuconostoc lactis]
MGISCIVTVFNKENYIRETLNSIQRQTYSDFEAIVINDGSTDKTEKIIKEFEDDERFIIITKENGGVSSARNLGLKISRKSHIVFVDGDDFVDEEYLAKLNENLTQKNTTTVISGLDMGHTRYVSNNQILTNQELVNNYGRLSSFINTPVATLYSSEIIKNNNICFDEEMQYAEDLDFNLRYFEYPQVVSIINNAYYHVVESKGGLSRRFVPKMIDYQLKIMKNASNVFDIPETREGMFAIIIKAVKTVLNHDIQNSNLNVFSKHVHQLADSLAAYHNFSYGVSFFGNYQNKIILYLLRHNQVEMLYFIFKVKVALQKGR